MNKRNKIIILMLVILVVMGVATQVFMSSSSIETDGSKNITDMANRTVTIPNDVGSVISTSPSMTMVAYMVAPDKVKALNNQWSENESQYVPSKYSDLPAVGGWYGKQDGSYEEFIAAKPDIILESTFDKQGNADLGVINERQEKMGSIPVVAVGDTSNLTTIDKPISFVGELLGASDKAKQLIDFNNKYMNTAKEKSSKLSDDNKKTVYYANGPDGLKTYPSGISHSQLIDYVGGKNVADSLNQTNASSGVQVSIEQIIKWDPDVIITNDIDFYNSVYNNSNWALLKAVKNKEVYVTPQFPFKWFDNPVGANMIMGLPWAAKVIYPKEYKDLNLVNTTKEFYSNFYHFDLTDNQAKEILTDSGIKESNL